MKSTLLFSALSLFSAISFSQATSYPNGTTVADFTVTDTDGNTINLYSITASGKYVLVDFFFDTCGPCQATQTYFNEVYDKYGCNSADLFCVSINNGTDSDAEVIAYEATYGGPFNHSPAVSADGGSTAVKNAFGVSAYPTYCLIGPDNKMVVNDIWPISNAASFEAQFPSDINEAACSFASIHENTLTELSIYPNPANNMVQLSFESKSTNQASIIIYSVLGHQVMDLSREVASGKNILNFDVSELAEGQYIVQIATESSVENIKFNVVK